MECLTLCTQRGGKTKDSREVERATRDKTETLRTGSRAINAQRNRRDGNAEEATHEETGNETVGAEKRETGKRYGRGGNGRTARDETGKRYGRDEDVRLTARDETGKRYGRGGNVGRTAPDETGIRNITRGR